MAVTNALRNLYLVDQQVRGLSSRLESAERHARAQQIKIEQLSLQVSQLIDQLHHTEAEATLLENEVNVVEEKIERHRQQMNSVKTNREYSALLVEVNTLKIDMGKLEDQTIQQLTQIDGLKAQLQELKAKLAEQERIKQMADQELTDQRAEVGDRLDQLKQERADAASQVPSEALTLFERSAVAHDGEAMAEVICDDRRRMEYSCGGCYMQIPVERVNLLARRGEVIRCPSCARILYLAQETEAEMGL